MEGGAGLDGVGVGDEGCDGAGGAHGGCFGGRGRGGERGGEQGGGQQEEGAEHGALYRARGGARYGRGVFADLPVCEALPRLLEALAVGNAVLVAPPGAGKTTAVPLALLEAGWRGDGRILVLEPRRLAARAAAARMSAMLGEAVGQTVGYRTRLDSAVSAATRIEVVTDGLLVRRLVSDPGLDGVVAVVLDEVHERSLDSDLAFAFCLDLQRLLRPELRLLAMSADVGCGAADGIAGGTADRERGADVSGGGGAGGAGCDGCPGLAGGDGAGGSGSVGGAWGGYPGVPAGDGGDTADGGFACGVWGVGAAAAWGFAGGGAGFSFAACGRAACGAGDEYCGDFVDGAPGFGSWWMGGGGGRLGSIRGRG